MGREKLTLEVGGATLISRVRAALEPSCQEILLVGGEEDGPGLRRVPDRRPGREGPLAGLEAGLAASSLPIAFVAAGDMPFISRGLVAFLLDRLLRSGGSLRAVVPRHEGLVHPLCAAYDHSVLPEASRLLDAGTRAVWKLLESLGEGVDYVEEELDLFGDPGVFLMNVNSPADLARARAAYGGGG